MDHEIQNDVNIQASRRKCRQPMYLEKLWPRCRFACRSDDRIEAFHMTDLQYTIILDGGIDQGLGSFDRRGNWFFNEDVDAMLEQINADSGMVDCRNCQAHRIHFAKNVLVIGKCRSPVKACNFFRTRLENINHTNQFDIRDIRIKACMLPSQMSYTDDSCSNHGFSSPLL